MSQPISLPLWLVLLLTVFAAWAALERLLVPSVRWFLRQRTNRVIEEINTRLRIRLQPFTLTKREVLIDRLLYDPKVQEAAEAFAREQRVPRELAMERVERYAGEIVPSFNAYVYFRVGYWLARQVARSLYRVRLGYSDEEGLAALTPDATVVFIMNHRSNMDYILVAYLAAERAAISYAVGEWARIWPLHMLIRSMGAYFVRRGSGNDLYRRVLERYVQMATEAGVTQAIYPEGGLSRDGCLRQPKLGLLDYLLRAYDPAGRDLVFIPVGINYDRVLEDRTLLLDTEPAREGKERAGAVATTLRFLAHNLRLRLANRWYRFGYGCVNFGAPISMRAYAARRGDLRDLPREERFARVQELASELMAAVGAVIPVLPVPLVATVFVRHPEERFSELELKARVCELMGELERIGAHLYIPRTDQDYAIHVGLRMLLLRRLVGEQNGLYASNPAELPLLRYYANSISHLFAPEPAVSPGGNAALGAPND